MEKKIALPAGLKDLARCFDKPIYVVGGYVRDSLIGFEPHDVDLTGDLDPEVVFALPKERFIVKETSKKLLTLKIIDRRYGTEYEFTSFRTDSYSDGKHRPDAVKRTGDILSDALRRDFCANAIYYDVKSETLSDPLGGVHDVEKSVLRMTRENTFCEDGLRLMRLCRQAAETGFSIDPETKAAARKNREAIDDIAPERIRDELDRILVADLRYGVSDGHYRGVRLLDEIGVFEKILPEIALGKGMEQRPDYHKYDVQEHMFRTMQCAHPSVRLAALLHDCGKPYCKLTYGNFHGHDIEGEPIADKILHRFRYPNDVIKETKALVLHHMFDLKCDAKENTVRRFVQSNVNLIDKLLLLKEADYLGGGLVSGTAPGVERISRIYNEMLKEQVPFSIKDLGVDGHDLEELGVPERSRGEALKRLLSDCALKDTYLVTREAKLDYLRQFV
ncbi:MAG: CCA tRNA nucleotidyltransferase [Clostridia bacterium]|nr:CCA tRNA nucleotidyltransferase [Clostridia bacterium]